MFKKNLFLSVLSIVFLLSALVKPAHAVTDPTFPSCLNPQGELKVAYTTGTHGVPGDSNTYSGQDSVYTLSEATLTQCLCTVNGSGIQTNWWKVSSISQEQINVLVNQGWFFIPDGSAWGLQRGYYLAKNSSYACTSLKQNGGGPGDGLSDGRSDGLSSCPSCTQDPQGQVLGISTQAVLGLASTGNILFIISVFGVGTLFLAIGLLSSLKKKQKGE